MTFPLMTGYDHINLVPLLDPVAELRDRELGERMRRFSRICPVGSPDFGYAVQRDTEWRILSGGAEDPVKARYSLGVHLRRTVAEDGPGTATARAMLTAADRLDPEDGEQLPKDEWEVGDRRYRIIRIENFTLIGGGLMEPPRSTDVDLGHEAMLCDHLIDPRAPCGQWETQLRLNLVGHLPVPGTVPEIVHTEAQHGLRSHPGVVLLPPTFVMVEIKGTAWEPLTGADTPDDARGHLAGYFSQMLPWFREYQGDSATPDELAAWAKAAATIEASEGPEFQVLGRRFRTVRVTRLLRLGRDGPESPRPSDQEQHGPPSSP